GYRSPASTGGVEGRENHMATLTLRRDLAEFHSLKLNGSGQVIRLAIAPGAIATNAAQEIDRQAYRLRIHDRTIEVTGNTDQGLLYGVQTLLQLPRRDSAGRLPV